MKNLYVRISLICGALSTSYFVNQYFEETYFRRLRFIRKLARTYFKKDDGTEQFDDQIIGNVVARSDGMHLHFGNMKQYVAQKFSTPTAIIYVQKVEAIKKIVQKAAKYGFKVTTMDVDTLKQSQLILKGDQEAYILKVQHKEYDQQTQIVKVGVGNRVQDVNQFLAQYGRRIPLAGQQRLFTILSDNSTPLDSVEYDNLNQVVTGLVAISPTSHQLQTETPTASPIINQLFIGQQHRFGIVYEVSLKTESLELPIKQEINLDKKFISKTNLYYLFDSLIKLSQQQRQKIQFLYDCYSNQYKIIQQGTQNLPDLKQTLDNVVDKYVTRQLWNQNNNKQTNNNINNNNNLNEEMTLQLKYQLSSQQLLSCLLQLKELQLKQQQQQFLVQVDFKTGFLTVNINNHLPSNEKLQMVKSFTHYISNRKGRFIQCNDKLINRMLKLETYPMELGLNSMRLEHQFAELIDKNQVMFHEFLQHTELDEQIS
ncbi:unnamed protein product (macronuclear) [Paramecium tetraurelia]|uniref:FAD-binding PCMH-type domain-containing protein n=1 Tax=Paramecium tetraurelia TaxID=5888 RepID=A0BUJ7_PARTE|nr:uncharacterized protein GSPATT00005460001 [Paramecium tetraurelia]CAK62214.1 unnamed protein product [Paramecium tetraurelia]|eukprot:XP_001429612.1 hypothetical protein (macronuclear) [Paramecium tetraurelia strain d4-2]